MKHFYLIICVFFLMSFKNTVESTEKTKNSNYLVVKLKVDSNTSGWGSWTTTDCLRGVDFRVKNDGYNKYADKYRWSIQFRNRYQKNIHFSYKAVPPSEKYNIRSSGKTTDRVHVKSGKTYETYYLVRSEPYIYVYINRIRIGDKDWGSDYIDCDK